MPRGPGAGEVCCIPVADRSATCDRAGETCPGRCTGANPLQACPPILPAMYGPTVVSKLPTQNTSRAGTFPVVLQTFWTNCGCRHHLRQEALRSPPANCRAARQQTAEQDHAERRHGRHSRRPQEPQNGDEPAGGKAPWQVTPKTSPPRIRGKVWAASTVDWGTPQHRRGCCLSRKVDRHHHAR